jgi:NTE family protein
MPNEAKRPLTGQNNNDLTAHRRERALVLGGGGAAGNAWVLGVIAGLAEAGLDVGKADRIIGTSAGATAAAQITSASPAQLYADVLAAVPPPQTGQAGGGRGPVGPLADYMARTSAIIESAQDAADMRRKLGAAALELAASSDATLTEKWRAIVAARLPSQDWPQRSVLITAVDAQTGEGVAFDRHSGISLVDAVAASTSSGPAYSIGEKKYIDGGYRRNENADLAAGYQRVLVLSPFGGRNRHPLEWGMQLGAQAGELRAGGSRVETIFPDGAAREVFAPGANQMDPSLRPVAARAGYDQGQALAEKLAAFWR